MTDSYITPLYIESSAEGLEYFGLYAGGAGYYIIIRRKSSASRRELSYATFTERSEFDRAGATVQSLHNLDYHDTVMAGINLNFLFAGSAIRASNTAALASTTDGSIDNGGNDGGNDGGAGGSGSGTPVDNEAQMQMMQMQLQRLVNIQSAMEALTPDGGLPVAVEFPRQSHVLVDNRNDDEALPVRVVGEPVLAPGAASETGQGVIAARVNQLLDTLVAGFAAQQNDALTDDELRARPVPVELERLPLPADAATAARQDQVLAALGQVLAALGQTQQVTVTNHPSAQAVTGTFWQATQPVSAATLPLPTGASTAALQTAGNTALDKLAANSPALVGGKVPVVVQNTTTPTGFVSYVSSAGDTNRRSVTTAPTDLTGWQLTNRSNSSRIVQVYNKATAPANGDTAVLFLTLPAGAAISMSLPAPVRLSAGLAFGVMTANTPTLNLAAGLVTLAGVAADDVTVNLFYQPVV